MNLPPWAWVAGAAVVVVGTGVAVGQASASPSPALPPAGGASGSGTAPPAASPIAITQGHRYQVTLTFAGQSMAALAANVLPNLAAGLANVAPGEFTLVSSSATATTVVYVVDATGGAPGSVTQESPQTFYADLNAAQFGGIGVAVVDQGVSPVASGGGALPVGGTGPSSGSTSSSSGTSTGSSTSTPSSSSTGITPQTPVTDPALITYAQRAILAATPSAGVTATGTVDAPTLAAVQAYQAAHLPSDASGVLDYLTWANLVSYAFTSVGSSGLQGNVAITDATTIAFAQNALALGIAAGTFPSIDYGAAQETGVASDPAWTAALGTAMGEVIKTLATIGITNVTPPTNGTLDYVALAVLITWSFAPPVTFVTTSGVTVAPVEPATPVTLADQVTFAQKALAALPAATGTRSPAQNATFAAVPANGNPADPTTVAAVTLLQSTFTGLQHRTTPGSLDYLTFAAIVAGSLQPATPPAVTIVASAPLVTDVSTIAGAQEAATLVVANGRLPGPLPAYTRNELDGNPQNASFVAAVAAIMKAVNTAWAPSHVSLPADGSLDLNVFAVLFVLAYL